jgi:hypothetical protein
MGNYLVNKYTKFNEPTITSMYYEKAIHMHKNGREDYCLKMDRILDAENQIYIGIGSKIPDNNQMSLQVIRLGDYTNKYYRLLQFTENENKLKYKFEDDITLTLIKNHDYVLLRLSHLKEDKFISVKVDPTIVKSFKPINFASNEFDKIHDLFDNGIKTG